MSPHADGHAIWQVARSGDVMYEGLDREHAEELFERLSRHGHPTLYGGTITWEVIASA